MALLASQIVRRLSTRSATQGYAESQTDKSKSLGGYMATTLLSSSALHNVFDEISDAENTASQVDYRCIFFHNTSGIYTAFDLVVWIDSEVASGASLSIGVDPTAASRYNTYDAQAVSTVSEFTAPTGVTFSAPTTKGTGLAMGDLAPGEVRALWLKRTAANTAAVTNDGAVLGYACNRLVV